MRRKTKALSIFLLLSILVIMGGCRENRTAQFLWPDLDDPYSEAVRKWTRKGAVYSGIETEIIVHATLKSRAWQKAYIEKKAQAYSLSIDEQAELHERLEEASQRETEVFLSVFSPKPEQAGIRLNDPLWSIFIHHEDKKIYPLEIRPVRQPLARLQAFYPYVRQWRQNYILRFPGAVRDSLVIIMTGPLGRVELDW